MERGVSLSGLPGLYLPGQKERCQRSFVKNLDQLPLADSDLWPALSRKEDLWMPVQTRRGCPLRCSYCSTELIEGRGIRRHSPGAIVQWIARWRKEGIHQFYFVDNTFNLPTSYAKEICRQLIHEDLKIRWWSILYPKHVDEELVGLMAKAGCEQVSVGFESGSEQVLKNMNKKFNPREVREISERLSEHGIRQMGFLLLGSPGETRESVKESLFFADSLKLDALKITVGVRIYPHTSLAEGAIRDGMILSHDDLLFPRFYLAKVLESWVSEILRNWSKTRPRWILPGQS
jgi:radical SAM superfamily enzyme YgiQ (UPF0313 family)